MPNSVSNNNSVCSFTKIKVNVDLETSLGYTKSQCFFLHTCLLFTNS